MKDLILFGILLLLSVIKGEFVVPGSVIGQIGDSAKLECKLIGNYRWYAISWKKIEHDGTENLIVTLPIDTREPDWNSQTVSYYGSRYSPVLNMNGDITEFSLNIKSLLCSDRGEYACNVVGNFPEKSKSAEIIVGSEAEKPSIEYDVLVMERNTTFELSCEANIGVPVSHLVWLHKAPGSSIFEMIENQVNQEEIEITACEKQGKSNLEIFVTAESAGSIYRCALHGRHNEVAFYDEVTIELVEIPTTTAPDVEEPKCEGTVCILETKEKDTGRSSVVVVTFNCLLLMVSFIWTLFIVH